jgi:hypothetical protein
VKKILFFTSALLSFMLTSKVLAQTPANILGMLLSPNPIQVGKTLALNLSLTVNQKVNAADVFLSFDPKFLELTGATGSANFKTIAPGDGLNLDLQKAGATGSAHVGFAAFDMIAERPTASISGTNLPLGTIFFKALKAGSTYLTVTDGNAVAISNGTPINILQSLPATTAEQIIYACTTLDFDKSGQVDIRDIQAIAANWNSGNLNFDLDGNGVVDVRDIQSTAARWLEICQ